MANRKRIIVGAVVCCLLGVVGYAGGKFFSTMKAVTNSYNPLVGWDLMKNPRNQFPGKSRVNILLIGKDYNHTNKGILYTKQARSDTLILFSFDLDNKKVSAISIPRDTYVPWRGGKINAAYTEGGEKLARETVGKLLGVTPDYSIALKADAVKTMVDEIGGVEVTSLDKMKYDDNWGGLHIDLPEGTYNINGDQAIGYTRFRKMNPGLPHSKEEGDLRRQARQQNLLRALIAKAKSPSVLPNADKVINKAWTVIEPTLKKEQLFALATMYRDMNPSSMQTASLFGEDSRAGRLYVWRMNEDKNRHLVDWLIKGDEKAADKLTVVAVQNGTKVRGAARKIANVLKDEGFDAHPDRNPPPTEGVEEVAATKIVYRKAIFQPRAERIGRLLGVQNIVKDIPPVPTDGTKPTPVPTPFLEDPENAADVTIVLGRDVAAQFVQERRASR